MQHIATEARLQNTLFLLYCTHITSFHQGCGYNSSLALAKNKQPQQTTETLCSYFSYYLWTVQNLNAEKHCVLIVIAAMTWNLEVYGCFALIYHVFLSNICFLQCIFVCFHCMWWFRRCRQKPALKFKQKTLKQQLFNIWFDVLQPLLFTIKFCKLLLITHIDCCALCAAQIADKLEQRSCKLHFMHWLSSLRSHWVAARCRQMSWLLPLKAGGSIPERWCPVRNFIKPPCAFPVHCVWMWLEWHGC